MAAVNDISGVTNVELWNLARKANPKFASHTAEGTADLFTERGFEALARTDVTAINEFFEISLRVGFQMLTVSRAKNPLEGKGLVQVYATPNGGYTQRMAVKSIKPVTPKFHGLQNGDSIDPFIVRKPEATERFFQQNFSYQSFVTLQDFQVKTIFISERGMGEFVAGVMQGLSNGYTIQEFENTLEALNKAINSQTYPLQDSQKVEVTVADADAMTNEELTTAILAIKDLISAMQTSAQTGAYNAGKFASTVDTSDLVCIMRPSLKNRIAVNLLTGAIHPENLSLPVEVIELQNFGGLTPTYVVEDTSYPVFPAYDTNGEQVGWSLAEGGDVNPDLHDDMLTWIDPNEDVLAVIAQKGLIFENKQNPYVVTPIYNPRGLYTNYWASSANNAICVDPYYNLVVVKAVAGS